MPEDTSTLSDADNGEPDGLNDTLTSPISPDGHPQRSRMYVVPARSARAVRLEPGQRLTVINTYGTQVCDMWAFHAQSMLEFMSMEHLRVALNGIMPKVGDALVTNHRRPILTLVEDTSPGIHDTLIAACDIYRYHALGVTAYHDNCTDNLRMAMKAIGLRAQEIPSPLNLWMNVPLQSNGTIAWLSPVSKPMDALVFRAEMACIVVLSACPQDLVPVNGVACVPSDIQFEVS